MNAELKRKPPQGDRAKRERRQNVAAARELSECKP